MAASGALLALLAAGIALRFYRLGDENFWFDELWTAVVSDPSLPLSQLMRIWILPDVHPPLYYLMLREWRTWFGSDEWWLRLPSAVSGVLTVAVVPLVQRWLPVVRRPLVLAAWLAASTGGIVYAQEARHYTLLLFMATAATLIATGLAHRIARGGSILVPALVLAAVTTVLEYVHYFGVLLTAGLFTALYLFARVHRDRAAERIVLAAGTASLLLFLPWLLHQLPHVNDKLGGRFWITNNWGKTLPELAGYAAGRPAVFLAVSALIAWPLLRCRGCCRRADYFVPIASIAAVMAGALIISLHSPMITARNLFVTLPAFYIAGTAAFGDLERYGGRWQPVFFLMPVAVIGLCLATAAWRINNVSNDRWRAAADLIVSMPGCDRGALPVHFFPREMYAYYLPAGYRERVVRLWVDSPTALPPVAFKLKKQDCPLLLWSGHIESPRLAGRWLERLGIPPEQAEIRILQGHTIILDRERRRAGR
jgi:uncharacterized membrane protein